MTCNIFEHVLFSQIMRHYTRHMFINPLQHGFQKGLSCETQLATTVDQLQKRLDDKQQVDLIILDFQKAFDKVPHRHLLNKLHESGIHGHLHEWLTSYLTERTNTASHRGWLQLHGSSGHVRRATRNGTRSADVPHLHQ